MRLGGHLKLYGKHLLLHSVVHYHGLRRKYPFRALSEDWERSPICHNQLLKDNISIEEVDVHMFAVLDVSLST